MRTNVSGGAARLLCLACLGVAACEAAAAVPRDVLPQTTPLKTVRFPGGNYGHVVVRDGLAVTCSGWSREDTSAVFDVTDPSKPRFLARFPAKGYSCADPVFFGDRCYVPNGFCATVIDLSDRRAPKLAGYLNPQFPKDGCRRLWVEGGRLYFTAHDGTRLVGADGLSSEKADKVPPKPVRSTPSPETGLLKDSAVIVGTAEIPYAYSLASVAADGGQAFVYAPTGADGAHLLTLPDRADGLTLFSGVYKTAPVPRGNSFQAMGMQTACNVMRVGNLFFVDDGIVRRSRSGQWETLLNRTRAAANASLDGTRLALAQGSRCRILDFGDVDNVRIHDVVPSADRPLHITGCHLRSNELFVAYTLVESKGQDFIYRFPTKGYVAAFDLRDPSRALSTVEISVCVALDRVGDCLYVSCRKGDFAVIDASDPRAMKVSAIRRDILDGDGYKVKTFGGRTYVLNGESVAELDTTVPAVPQVRRLYARGVGTAAPSYDDFTVEGGRLYALAHASLDVFELEDASRTVEVRNACGENGVLKAPLVPVETDAFAGHVPNPKPPTGVTFRAGRFGNAFGAYVFDWVQLPDGRYAVAYGEAGLVFCDAKGGFASELPRGTDGWVALFAAEVVVKDDSLYVKDGDGRAFRFPVARQGETR